MVSLIGTVFSIFLMLLASGLWIAIAAAIVGLALMYLEGGWSAMLMASSWVVWNQVNSFTLVSVPLFVLMGYIILESKVGARIFNSMAPVLDHFPGGLLYANILAGGLFAAISGSSVAAGATIGSVSLPEMDKRGYPFPISAGSLGAGSVLAPLIPPSLIMIFYCSVTEQSIGKQFIAGIIPGIILMGLYIVYITIMYTLPGHSKEIKREVLPWKTSLVKTKDIWLVLFLIALVLGSIFTGIAAPSEAAAIGTLGSVLLAIYNRGFGWKMLKKATFSTLRLTSQLFFILFGVKIMSTALARAGLITFTTKFLLGLNLSPLAIFAMIAVIFLVLGCFIEGIPMMLMIVPVVYPTLIALGYDPIWFGIQVVILCNVGNFTPPVGVTLFVLQSLCPDRPVTDIYKGVTPFAAVTFVMLIILLIFPDIATFLPKMMLGG